jgi:hypothetical protein
MNYVKLDESILDVRKEPLAGDTLVNLLRLLAQNRFNIDVRYLPRVLYLTAMSSLLVPFRLRERLKFDRIVRDMEIRYDPVFILGHWRSGTTYLHNLLSPDKNLGYFSTYQAILPGVFLTGESLFKDRVTASLPEKRPIDDVMMSADSPQEDEYAVGAFTPYSGNHAACFPKNGRYYRKFILMEDVQQRVVKEWKKVYLYLVRKITLYWGERRVVLKNPANTARVRLILELFPDAKFVFLFVAIRIRCIFL